jgi:hypothetical protein
VLAGKPYNGVIQALVMGDDSQISVGARQLSSELTIPL